MPLARVRVHCRLHPTERFSGTHFHILPDGTTINVSRTAGGGGGGDPVTHSFTFDSILHGGTASQDYVYQVAASELVESGLLSGISATLLCYGQRCSGKSYTLFGGEDYRTRGVAPRAIHHLFHGIASYADERAFTVSMSFLQLFGDQVTDLLSSSTPNSGGTPSSPPSRGASAAHKATITLDGHGDVVLKNIVKVPCSSEAEALAVLFRGHHQHRAVAGSRGAGGYHLVVSLHVEQRNLVDTDPETRHACLHLVDLAGMQTVDSSSDPAQRTQVQMVNRSLTMLEQVVMALASSGSAAEREDGSTVNGRRHVPYRQSKLTTLLKGCMGGRCLTSLIAHICPEKVHVDAAFFTLTFAKRMMRVTSAPVANITVDSQAQVRNLQRQLTDLRAELRLQSQLNARNAGGAASSTLPASASSAAIGSGAAGLSKGVLDTAGGVFGVDEVQSVQEKVYAYVDGNSATLPIHDVREMQSCFAFMRSLIEQRDLQIAELRSEVNALAAAAAAAASAQAQATGAASTASSGGPAANGSKTNTAAADSVAGAKRTKRGSLKAGPAAPPPLPLAGMAAAEGSGSYSPSTLDMNTGIGYGISARAKQTIQEVVARDAAAALLLAGTAPLTAGAGTAPAQAPLAPSPPWQPPPPSPATVRPHTSASAGRPALPSGPAGVITPYQFASTVPPLRPIMRSGEVDDVRKAAAFEDYKSSGPGALQVRAIAMDQRQLAAKQAHVAELQRRVEVLLHILEQCRLAEHARPQLLLPAASRLTSPLTSSLRRPLSAATYPSDSLLSAGPLPSCVSSLGGAAVGSSASITTAATLAPTSVEGLVVDPIEGAADHPVDPRSLSLAQVTAHHRHAEEELHRAQGERTALMRQVERRQVALLTNFNEWYSGRFAKVMTHDTSAPLTTPHRYLQVVLPSPASATATKYTRAATATGPSGRLGRGAAGQTDALLDGVDAGQATVCGLAMTHTDRSFDAAEQFEALAMQRRIAREPESAAYYSAKKQIGAELRGNQAASAEAPRKLSSR